MHLPCLSPLLEGKAVQQRSHCSVSVHGSCCVLSHTCKCINTSINPTLLNITLSTKFKSIFWLPIAQVFPLTYRQKNHQSQRLCTSKFFGFQLKRCFWVSLCFWLLIGRSHGDLPTGVSKELFKFMEWCVEPLWATQQFPKPWP